MQLLFQHGKYGGLVVAVGAAITMAANPASAQPAQSALDAAIQARIAAARAQADASVARARAQVAEAEARAKSAAQTGDGVTVVQNSGGGVNSISVVGNHAGKVVVECQGEPGTEVNVNSVVADGQSLKGKTVVVTGRNTRDVELRGNCKPGKGGSSQSSGSKNSSGNAAHVNSVIIR